MWVNIFKTSSVILVTYILFIILSERELVINKKENLSNLFKEKTTTQINTENKTKDSTKIEERSKVIKNTETINNLETTKNRTLTEQKNNYEELYTGESDTDESYTPVISLCEKPIGYKVGVFDTRFGITKELFLEEIKKSGDIWNKATSKNIFYYDENSPLTINLIYDKRQSETEQINLLTLEIENSKKYADNLLEEYKKEKLIYDGDFKQLSIDIDEFKKRNKAYNDKVAEYNSLGTISQTQYDEIKKEMEELKKIREELEKRNIAFNAFTDNLNQKIKRYNEFVIYINDLIKKTNSLGGRKFTEGKFTPSNNTIDIFQFSSILKLRRVLTHEFGHALGIRHTENIYSIMYNTNSATTTTLSKEDISALKEVCDF